MPPLVSKHQGAGRPLLQLEHTAQQQERRRDEEAVEVIVSAFVDLGFSSSATHRALHAANKDQSIRNLAAKSLSPAA